MMVRPIGDRLLVRPIGDSGGFKEGVVLKISKREGFPFAIGDHVLYKRGTGAIVDDTGFVLLNIDDVVGVFGQE